MIDFLNIPKEDQEKLLFDLFSIIDFTRSIIGGSYHKNLHVIILNIMGEFAATKGFISIKEGGRFRILAHKGRIDKVKTENFINEKQFQEDTCISNEPGLKEIECSLIIPVKRACILGYIGLEGPLVLEIYKKKKDFYLNAFINIASLVIDNELLYKDQTDLNKKLEQKIYQLKTIFDTSTELNLQLDEMQILDITLHTILGQFLISKAVFVTYTVDDRTQKIDTNVIIKGIKQKEPLNALFLNKSYISYLKTHDIVKLDDIKEDLFNPIKLQNLFYIFPLKYQDSLLGAVLLGKKMGIYDITQQDQDFLKTLLTQAQAEVLNVRLFKEYTEKTIIEREISIAKEIQHRLLPKSIPRIQNYSIHSYITQCNELGGDFYNIFKLKDNKYAFLVGDVSGKGIPAALIMSNIQALVQAIFSENVDINSGMQKINRLLFESTEQNRYATLIFIILWPEKNRIIYTNAGHNQPFLCERDSGIKYLEKGGIPVGIFPNASYETEEIKLKPGDAIVLYTDGVTEAQDQNEAEFGQMRLESSVKQSINLDSTGIAQNLISSLERFKAGQKQNDDLTLLIIKRTG